MVVAGAWPDALLLEARHVDEAFGVHSKGARMNEPVR